MELTRLSHEEEEGRGQLCICRPLGGEHFPLLRCLWGKSWDPGEDIHSHRSVSLLGKQRVVTTSFFTDLSEASECDFQQGCLQWAARLPFRVCRHPGKGTHPRLHLTWTKCPFSRDQAAPPNHDLSGDHASSGPLVLSPGSFSKTQRLGSISRSFGLNE